MSFFNLDLLVGALQKQEEERKRREALEQLQNLVALGNLMNAIDDIEKEQQQKEKETTEEECTQFCRKVLAAAQDVSDFLLEWIKSSSNNLAEIALETMNSLLFHRSEYRRYLKDNNVISVLLQILEGAKQAEIVIYTALCIENLIGTENISQSTALSIQRVLPVVYYKIPQASNQEEKNTVWRLKFCIVHNVGLLAYHIQVNEESTALVKAFMDQYSSMNSKIGFTIKPHDVKRLFETNYGEIFRFWAYYIMTVCGLTPDSSWGTVFERFYEFVSDWEHLKYGSLMKSAVDNLQIFKSDLRVTLLKKLENKKGSGISLHTTYSPIAYPAQGPYVSAELPWTPPHKSSSQPKPDPQPQPKPAPQPQTKPAPQPQPTPTPQKPPKPTPQPTPTPQKPPKPTPQPTPTPQKQPKPTLQPTPSNSKTSPRETNSTTSRESNSTSSRQPNSTTSPRETNSTSSRQSNSTSSRELNSTSPRQSNSTSSRQSNSTSGNPLSSTSSRAPAADNLESVEDILKNIPVVNFKEEFKDRHIVDEGGFGLVWSASWRNGPVAVKQFRNSLETQGANVLRKIKKELVIISKMRHDRTLTLLYHCRDAENIYLVTQFYKRKSLHHLLYQENITLQKDNFCILIQDVCGGLIYLHNWPEQILHLDLKPKNILIDGVLEPRAIIADFGLSMMKRESQHSAAYAPCGTFPYMAPEIGLADPSDKTDIYSLGIIMWEILHKKVPYSEVNPPSKILEIVRQGTRPVFTLPFPPQLVELIEKCWSADVNLRPTANDVLKQIEIIYGKQDIKF